LGGSYGGFMVSGFTDSFCLVVVEMIE
jgi:hypothetical protein